MKSFFTFLAAVLGVFVFMAGITPAFANHQPAKCNDAISVLAQITKSEFNEKRLLVGDSTLHPGFVLELWTNSETGEWTIIFFNAKENVRCVQDWGGGLEPFIELEIGEVPEPELAPQAAPVLPELDGHFHDESDA
jgi:hypothetical protein